jgi:hypothetical protein
LNIESCCVIPSHASIRSKQSATSGKPEPLKDATRDLSTLILHESMTPIETMKVENCSKKSCCTDDTPEVTIGAVPKVTLPKNEGHSKKSCCNGDPPKVTSEAGPEANTALQKYLRTSGHPHHSLPRTFFLMGHQHLIYRAKELRPRNDNAKPASTLID